MFSEGFEDVLFNIAPVAFAMMFSPVNNVAMIHFPAHIPTYPIHQNIPHYMNRKISSFILFSLFIQTKKVKGTPNVANG